MAALTSTQILAFQTVRNRLSDRGCEAIDAAAMQLAGAARAAGKNGDFAKPARLADVSLGEGRVGDGDGRRALIATWAMEMPDRIAAENLPPECLDLYPFWLDRMADYLVGATGAYDEDHWAKDVRFVLALSVPASRSLSVDLGCPLRPRRFVLHGLSGRGWTPLLTYLAAAGPFRPWLQCHIEARQLDDFTEEGWDRAWLAIAALCRARPGVGGVIADSWLLDPELAPISPKLAYLRAVPASRGAVLIHLGSAAVHTERAALKSPTRRALIESGAYLPRCWLLAWSRTSLIGWADQHGSRSDCRSVVA